MAVVRIRTFIDEMSRHPIHGKVVKDLSTEEWHIFEEVTQILKFPYDATLRMQREQYCPSDFYGDWENLKLEIQEFNQNPLAKALLQSMNTREAKLKTPTVLASVLIHVTVCYCRRTKIL